MSEKHEGIADPAIYYCFVDFEPNNPTVHVIPSGVVANAVKLDYEIWLRTPGRNGQAHNPNKLRRLKPKMLGMDENWMDEYLENWNSFID